MMDRSMQLGLSRRGFATGATATIATAALPSGLLAARDVSLRVATYRGGDALLFRLAGTPVPAFHLNYAEFASGNLIVEAINAGAIDYGGMSQVPLVFAAASRARLKAIATLKADVNEQVVLVPRDSSIDSIADLKGKRVGYVRATTTHYFLLKMLQEVGLGFGDIQPINLTPADGQAAFATGALDAWAIYGYVVPLVIAQQQARVLKTALGYLSGDYIVAARPEALNDPDLRLAIEGYLRLLRTACAWRNGHHGDYAQALAATIGIPAAFIEQQLEHESQPYRLAPIDDAVVASTQEIADAFFDAGVVTERLRLAPFFDRSLTAPLTEKSS